MADNQNASVSEQLLNDAADAGIVSKPAPASDTGDNDNNTNPNGNPPPNQNADELDDAKLLAALQKRGIAATSLADLQKPAAPAAEPTEEEKRAAAEQKRTKALKFGLDNRLFTQAEYEASIAFNSRKAEEVVKEDFSARLLKENPDLTQEDIDDLFEEKFFLSEPEGGAKHKLGQQELQEYYNRIKTGKYGKILDVEKVYEGYESNLSKAQSYATQIDQLFKEIPATLLAKINDKEVPAFSFKIGPDNHQETIPSPIDLTLLDAIKKDYLTEAHMTALIDQTGNIADKKAVTEEILKDLFWRNKDKIMTEVATAYSDKKLSEDKRGRRNAILPESTSSDGKRTGTGVSDQMMNG
jgi:hypothetical protein